MTVLLDTGPIVAMFDRDDPEHAKCLEAMHAFTDSLITCDAVITEACYLLRHLPGAAHDLLMNVDARRFLIEYRISERADELARLMAKYADVPMDLADACLVDLAQQHQTGRILTLDGDFRVYRWGRNKPFDLLFDEFDSL